MHNYVLTKWRRNWPSKRIWSLYASHTTDDASRCRKCREFWTTKVTNIMPDGRKAAECGSTELRRVFKWVNGLVRQTPLRTHFNQTPELILLAWGCLGEEEIKHLFCIGIVLNFHVPFDCCSYAVDTVFRLEGQGSKMTWQSCHFIFCTESPRSLDLLEASNFLKQVKFSSLKSVANWWM